MKLALGTVQFGLPYGISNKTGVPAEPEIASIFNLANREGIDTFDTAVLYGKAEEITGRYAAADAMIVSKFPAVKSSQELRDNLDASRKNLAHKCLYAYLAHNADTIIKDPGLWQVLKDLKADGLLIKAGYSLYTVTQLEQLLDLGLLPDIVQLPYSLLDRQFENALQLLKALGSEIHIRSVFLQGLYFMDSHALPQKLLPLAPALAKVAALCSEFGTDINALALNFVADNPFVDKVVIGVESAAQLNMNIRSLRKWNHPEGLMEKIKEIEVAEPTLLNPANW